MDNFRFFALGEDFDVDAFRTKYSLVPRYVWRKGEQQRNSCTESPYPSSGIEFALGNETELPFATQQALAIAFIQRHRETLRALADFPGVTHCALGLEYVTSFEDNVVCFCLSASTKLMRLLAEIGFELTHYVKLERSDPENDA
jgi:hypothetical protein